LVFAETKAKSEKPKELKLGQANKHNNYLTEKYVNLINTT
jgi:hypothetical protein